MAQVSPRRPIGIATVPSLGRVLAMLMVVLGALPAAAQAHGPVAPIASSYLARVRAVPPGVSAKVIDGDQRMWIELRAAMTLVVMDSRGAPYLRFDRSGIAVNHNSAMYYLNQSPAQTPPAGLRASTPPSWSSVSSAHAMSWHDGRLHALANVAIAPGASYVGQWRIPLQVNGRPSALAGGVYHAPGPSLAWFWPIVVFIACAVAARRVGRPELDARIARLLGVPVLVAVLIAALARDLHGRPTVSPWQLITLTAIAVFVAWAVRQLTRERPTYFTYFPIAFVALWEGLNLIPTLLDGFVLGALPAFLTRVAAVVCLGGGAALLVVPSRLGEARSEAEGDHLDPEARESYA
jgi:hypothetical protein